MRSALFLPATTDVCSLVSRVSQSMPVVEPHTHTSPATTGVCPLVNRVARSMLITITYTQHTHTPATTDVVSLVAR